MMYFVKKKRRMLPRRYTTISVCDRILVRRKPNTARAALRPATVRLMNQIIIKCELIRHSSR